ncbi:hypothetical protein [Herbidospora yilanensis]|uniref:hypothetical protein n=1 Tax=Herbidospora yilanensis TaxID=354426 RepID=UPI0007862477|nr:hypothetical protein [Herbidospora yilanensis]
MLSLRPFAGAILTSVLLTGYAAAPAAASAQESATVSQAAARPGNGKVIYDRISGGEGVLKIKNGTGKDGVVTLVRGKTKAFSLYVRAKSTASFKRVDDGTYTVYFTTGYRFNSSKRKFTKSAAYQRFNDRLKFTTTATQSTIWTLTLNPVRGGNARTSGVNPKDFPA